MQENKIKQGNLATIPLSCYDLALGPDVSITSLFQKSHQVLSQYFCTILDIAIAQMILFPHECFFFFNFCILRGNSFRLIFYIIIQRTLTLQWLGIKYLHFSYFAIKKFQRDSGQFGLWVHPLDQSL